MFEFHKETLPKTYSSFVGNPTLGFPYQSQPSPKVVWSGIYFNEDSVFGSTSGTCRFYNNVTISFKVYIYDTTGERNLIVAYPTPGGTSDFAIILDAAGKIGIYRNYIYDYSNVQI